MYKIKPLNRESLSDEDAPTIRKEAQEELTLDKYNQALKFLCTNNLKESEELLKSVLEENIPLLESQGGLPKTMSTLKYSCYINLGGIAIQRGDNQQALDKYISASDLDKTDVSLWHKIGTLALKVDRFRQAAYAFSQGLECNESHWPSLDKLITLLYGIRDTLGCLTFIGKALMLDPCYTRGLLIRKCIYKNNPATKEYYELLNPDHIYEPDINTPIDLVEEEKLRNEMIQLEDRINVIEKSLEPSPLPVVPLPLPLIDYTWLSVGKTVTHLHKYLAQKKLSHFCKIDLSKCMSQCQNEESYPTTNNSNENITCTKAETIRIEINEKCIAETVAPTETIEEVIECIAVATIENNEAPAPSGSASETETDNRMDIDVLPGSEELDDATECDVEEPAETDTEQKIEKNKANRRSSKRRPRDLLSDLQIWGWHSKRKTNKKTGGNRSEKDLTIEDALVRIIPNYLLPNGIKDDDNSDDTINLYSAPLTDVQSVVEENYLKSTLSNAVAQQYEDYFGSKEETNDVQRWWTQEWECCDVVTMLEQYVLLLANRWHLKWPAGLTKIYINAYEMLREHIEHPPLFGNDYTVEELQNDAKITLLYGELLHQQKIRMSDRALHPASLNNLQIISTWEESWGEEYATFVIRVHWLSAHLKSNENQNNMAVRSLQLIQELIHSSTDGNDETFLLCIPNCTKNGIVTPKITDKLLNHLEMMDSLNRIEELFQTQCYAEVATILESTFSSSCPPTTGRMGRPAQLAMLLNTLWFTDISRCFIWSEICLRETLMHYLKRENDNSNNNKWEQVLLKCLVIMHAIIQRETITVIDNLSDTNRVRLIDTLVRISCRQLSSESGCSIPLGSITHWILLHYVLQREEHRVQAKRKVKHCKKDEDNAIQTETGTTVEPTSGEEHDVPASVAVLFSAHEFLGPKGWCSTSGGELLHFMLDTILDRLDTPIFETLRDKIDIHLEQALFCLYQHPSKKNKVSRHLADHNVNPLPLSWERAHQLYEFYCPDALPEFDSYRLSSISSDTEQLLQRIVALVPTECDPNPLVPRIVDFINGVSNVMPAMVEFPSKVRAMYYLLGDYYLKQSEIPRSLKYLILDLSINPLRLDTWADIALAMASQLETKLNHCENFQNESEFLDKAKSAQICFKQALSLATDHCTLWIEFGSFEYMVHSFCSRGLKHDAETLSMEKFEVLENQKETYLTSCGESFTRALELWQPGHDADERWLHNYMIGKIAEKQRKEPVEYLQHYLTAAALLNENNATYPIKISYNNPQHLSLEALEIHYRIHASILKYLELHEGKPIPASVGKMFQKCLDNANFMSTPEMQPQPSTTKRSAEDASPAADNTNPSKKQKFAVAYRDVLQCIEEVVDKVVKEVDGADPQKSDSSANVGDVVLISDSDDERSPTKNNDALLTTTPRLLGTDKLRVRNVQEVMDAMMAQCMSSVSEYKSDDQTDKESFESEINVVIKRPESREKKEELVHSSADESTVRKSTEDSATSTTSSDNSSDSSDSSDSDSSSSSSTSSSCADATATLTELDVDKLVERCVVGLEECICRLPQNYKALYRLAHLYFQYGPRKDIAKSRQLLLTEYRCKNGNVVSGLFSDRKNNNFFNGVWRIPSSEIDRPGSLSAHMGRCTSLLLQILRTFGDHKILLELCLQLRRVPDADKIYIRNTERSQLAEQALSLCTQTMRCQIRSLSTTTTSASNSMAAAKLLSDIFKAYQRIQKHIVVKEPTFANMLTDVYKIVVQEQQFPETTNILDLAVKFCQQRKQNERVVQNQPQSISAASIVPRNPTVMNVPAPTVLPTPVAPPMRRPTMGRPRGRPPGPKMPGLQRGPRGRSPNVPSPSSPMSWKNLVYSMDPQTALNCMLKYQEELFKRYQHSYAQQMLPPFTMPQVTRPQNVPLMFPTVADVGKSKKDVTKTTSSYQMERIDFNKPKEASKVLPTSCGFSSSEKIRVDYQKSVPGTSKVMMDKVVPTLQPSATQQSSMKEIHLLKDRPNISITPVTQALILNNPGPKFTTAPSMKSQAPSTSPVKTLQEKLAERQKQNPNFGKPSSVPVNTYDFEQRPKLTYNVPKKPVIENVDTFTPFKIGDSIVTQAQRSQMGQLHPHVPVSSGSTYHGSAAAGGGHTQMPKLPSSLNISKTPVTTTANYPSSNRISISQIPPPVAVCSKKSTDTTKSSHFRAPSVVGPEKLHVHTTENLHKNAPPISLSVIRKGTEQKDKHKSSSDDDVIIIE